MDQVVVLVFPPIGFEPAMCDQFVVPDGECIDALCRIRPDQKRSNGRSLLQRSIDGLVARERRAIVSYCTFAHHLWDKEPLLLAQNSDLSAV